MKKILIISDGTIGEHFLDRVLETYTSENIYYVVETKAAQDRKEINPARFKFYEFDPTSFYKLANLMKMEFVHVFIVMDSVTDIEITIKNIRAVKKQLRIIVLDNNNMQSEDPNIVLVKANEILASRMLDYLPNVPVIAKNVGLGEGEIMEVSVPFGSSFVYRHIGVIEQKQWRIVAIYRNRKLIMPSRRRMIQPNDLLLLVGEQSVLQSVYRAIKRELGQFPAPFGTNLYLYIDMQRDNHDYIKKLVSRAVFVHKQFKHHLIIKVVNPCNFDLLEKITNFRCENIIIDIAYDNGSKSELILKDIKKYHVGLVMVSRELFKYRDTRQVLYEGHVPVLKIAPRSFSSLKDAVVVVTPNRDLEKVSTTVFDISVQMGFNLELFNYTSESSEVKIEVSEHYTNLSTIFSKTIKIIDKDENPIRALKQKENFLQCLPFSEKVIQRSFLSFLSTDSERLYHHLDAYHQIFIPVQI